MSERPAVSIPEAEARVGPVRAKERIQAIDILRGVSVLGILLVNMLGFAGYDTPFQAMGRINRPVVLLIKFFAQAKFYTLFSFLFGWGMAFQMVRAERRGTRFVPLYLRRLLILLLIGLIHAILIWDGDILVTYAVLAFPLLFLRKIPDEVLLVLVVVCMLVPILISLPAAQGFRESYAAATAGLRQAVAGANQIYAEGTYWEVTQLRWGNFKYGYSLALFWATHVFGMFLLGLYVGRRGIFEDIQAHLPLFRVVMWTGLVVGVICNLIFVGVFARPALVPPEFYDLATRGARTIGGPAFCLFYISAIVLLLQRGAWQRRLAPLAPVGRMALSNYLLHSVVCTLIFYGYGLGLYGRMGPAITLVLTFVIYRLQITLSSWWLYKYRFGPMEWLWRSLTYGKWQQFVPEWRKEFWRQHRRT